MPYNESMFPPTAESLKSAALALGFDAAGVARVDGTPDGEKLLAWIAAGRHGAMAYLEESAARRADIARWTPFARSVLMVAQNYPAAGPGAGEAPPGTGLVARYARGADYHNTMTRRLRKLGRRLKARHGSALGRWRTFCDAGAILEKAWGAAAGLGWIGKNTLLMNRAQGSWFLLGGIVLSLELEPDPPVPESCGSCTACLDACPTGAFEGPWRLDARRCISYLTIESRGEFPREFAHRDDGWLFGCDICQEVCPWNRFDDRRPVPPACEPALQPREGRAAVGLAWLARAHEDEIADKFRATPLARPGAAGLKRNGRAIS